MEWQKIYKCKHEYQVELFLTGLDDEPRKIMIININTINLASSYQAREEIDQEMVETFAENMLHGDKFPPILIYVVNGEKLIADGFHRYFAHKKNNKTSIDVDERASDMDSYILKCTSANNKHGKRPTHKDKIRSLARMLLIVEVSLWQDKEIARHLDVSTSFVYKHRENKPEAVTYERGGKKVTRARQVKKSKNAVEAPLDDPKETVVEEKNKEVIDYLSKEVETLSDKLAVASLEGSVEDKNKAKETIESLREEVRLLQIDNRSLKASMDKYQGENAQLKKQVAMLTKKLKQSE
jgi:hypothetical protein